MEEQNFTPPMVDKRANEQAPKSPEDLLWQGTEELSALRAPLVEHQVRLYEEIERMRAKAQLNLHERDVLAAKEKEYWRVTRKIEEIAERETKIVEALEALETGTIDEAAIRELVPPPAQETEQMSKRRKAMQAEQERLGMSAAEIAWHKYTTFGVRPTYGTQPNRLTTGHNLSRVHGDFRPDEAEAAFRLRTADTHGGKVQHGKDGNTYVSPSGRRIRKR